MKKKGLNWVVIWFMGIFLFLAFATFSVRFVCADEIWNFQSIYKMYCGGLMYTENNVIITPIFFMLGKMIFQLFGANLGVFKWYNVGIYFVKFLLMFAIFKSLKTKKFLAMLYVMIWLSVDHFYIINGANYNQLAIVFCLLGILCHVFGYGKKSYDFLQGFLLFLIFFTKQTIGVSYALGILLFEWLENGMGREFFRKQVRKLVTFLPCLAIACGIMFFRGNFGAFVNLCFGGLLEFGAQNRSFSWHNWKYIIFIVVCVGFSVFVLNLKNVEEKIKRNVKFLLCLAIGSSLNMFPLMNEYHVNIAMLFYMILFVYSIDQLLISEIFTAKSHEIITNAICCCILVALFGRVGYIYFSEVRQLERFEKESPFYPVRISSEEKQRMDEMMAYINKKKKEGIEVIVLSYEAASFMVPLQVNHGEFDLLFSGNLGYKGIQNTMEKISTMENTEFLIFTDEEDCFYQEPKEIRAYIMNHLEKKGEFLEYSIYLNESIVL